jgi:hypothetical protein
VTIYREKVNLDLKEVERINSLLAIESFEEMTDQELLDVRADTDTCEGIFSVKFDDGSTLNYDLRSGQHNYYDDVVWTSPDGARDVILECTFELDDIEFEVDGTTYEVVICV